MHIVHPSAPPPPPPPKFYITIVFDFSWDNCNTQEKLKQWLCNLFLVVVVLVGRGGGEGAGKVRKVRYGLCEHGKFITLQISFCIVRLPYFVSFITFTWILYGVF